MPRLTKQSPISADASPIRASTAPSTGQRTRCAAAAMQTMPQPKRPAILPGQDLGTLREATEEPIVKHALRPPPQLLGRLDQQARTGAYTQKRTCGMKKTT